MKPAALLLLGGVVPGLLVGCTSEKVAIGRQNKAGQAADGGAGNGTVGCNGNAVPLTSPSDGYLTIDVNGTSRQYVLELPTNYDGKTPVPVLFAFHGIGSDAQRLLGLGYGDIRGGTAGRVLLVGPNGLERDGQTGWNNSSSGLQSGVPQADIDFFDALVALLKANYCIDAGRVFAMGHGSGGMMANQVACVRGNVLRGVGPFAGAGPLEGSGVTCDGKVAAFIGHNPKEGDPAECAKMSSGTCLWAVLWSAWGWPTTRFWTAKNGCDDPGTMPTAAFDGNGTTGDPLPCKSFAGCDADYPVTLCLYDYWDEEDGPDAFPIQWGGKAATDFFLALPRVP